MAKRYSPTTGLSPQQKAQADRRERVLVYAKAYIIRCGHLPTTSELAREFGVDDKTIAADVWELVEQGRYPRQSVSNQHKYDHAHARFRKKAQSIQRLALSIERERKS